MTLSDAELVRRAQHGDLAAYADLIARHRQLLERYAYHLLGNLADAEDAMQDALLRAFRSLRRCEQPERVRGWLLRILVNRCRTRLARRSPVIQGPAVDQVLEQAASRSGNGEEWREEIDRALAALPPDQREAFLLKHLEEFSYDEMSALTGSSIPALKMRVSRACERLRNLLEDVYHA